MTNINEQSLIPVTDSQAKAVEKLASFGQTVVEEGGQLTRFIGRILGTAPEDAVGIILGDPLHHIRARIALWYDQNIDEILKRRNVKKTEPVSPSVAIPLLRAAYDESRPELQQLWAELIAAAMDPKRSDQMRLSFITTVKQFDPLDALVLRELYNRSGSLSPNSRDFLATHLKRAGDEIEISAQNLELLRCINIGSRTGTGAVANFHITTYGRGLIGACSG
jgi:Abortive infection alpha